MKVPTIFLLRWKLSGAKTERTRVYTVWKLGNPGSTAGKPVGQAANKDDKTLLQFCNQVKNYKRSQAWTSISTYILIADRVYSWSIGRFLELMGSIPRESLARKKETKTCNSLFTWIKFILRSLLVIFVIAEIFF